MRPSKRVAVVGVDLTPTGDDAIFECLRLMMAGAVETLHVLHVIDPTSIADRHERHALERGDEGLRRAPAMLEERVRDLAEYARLRVDSARVKGHCRLGEPSQTLLQMCIDYDADLLIVGTHSRRGLDRFLLGSVAERLVRKAHCPVLVVRAKSYAGQTKTTLPDPPYAPGEHPAR